MLPAGETSRVLILGGTREAYALAEAIVADGGKTAVTALVGATAAPRRPAGELRVGGFGGVEGLAEYLRQAGIAVVIDATHPFATRITQHGVAACAAAGVPYLRLERPAWTPAPGDRWHEVADLPEALVLLPRLGRRVLAALGHRQSANLPGMADIVWIVRSIEPLVRLPPDAIWLQERGPFTIDKERELLRQHRIDVILARASGGDGARAKLDAARELGLPVVLLRRPPRPDAPCVATVADALAWLDQVARERGRST